LGHEKTNYQHATGTLTVAVRILVADDNAELQALAKRVLEREGYVVSQVLTGVEMTRAIICNPLPDLVVLDIALPDADGRDLLASLKKDPRTAAIPVVVWSGRDPDSDRRIALELGAEDYLEKGSPSALVSKIERVLWRISQDSKA
jgi:CheY-like chemotaxis protein